VDLLEGVVRVIMQQILVISDETCFVHKFIQRLAPYDIEVLCAQNGEQALQVILDNSPELIVLPEHLQNLNAHEICRFIRSEGYTDLPVILLVEKDELEDIIAGLESGADSILPLSLSEDELIERIRARLRYAKIKGGSHQNLQGGNLIFDTWAHQVWCNGQALELSKREYELLKLLVSNAGHVLTKEVIFEHIWGSDSDADPEIIKEYIHLLRKKLSACGEEHLIHTLRFIGYVFKP
jgi:DNA-binding response OmpR family regulator